MEDFCNCGYHDEIGEETSNCGLGFYCCKDCPTKKAEDEIEDE